jgi:hypothetical protein
MYIDKAIERLNGIDWSNVGKNVHKDDVKLGVEFVKRMAKFCSENDVKPILPFMINIASYFGDYEIDESILSKCSNEVKTIINSQSFSYTIADFYLQTARLVDSNSQYDTYLQVYEPIIQLYEKGGIFNYREGGMSFIGSGLIPLSGWYETFKA